MQSSRRQGNKVFEDQQNLSGMTAYPHELPSQKDSIPALCCIQLWVANLLHQEYFPLSISRLLLLLSTRAKQQAN